MRVDLLATLFLPHLYCYICRRRPWSAVEFPSLWWHSRYFQWKTGFKLPSNDI